MWGAQEGAGDRRAVAGHSRTPEKGMTPTTHRLTFDHAATGPDQLLFGVVAVRC